MFVTGINFFMPLTIPAGGYYEPVAPDEVKERPADAHLTANQKVLLLVQMMANEIRKLRGDPALQQVRHIYRQYAS